MTEQSPPGFEQNADHGAALLRQVFQFLGGVGINGGNLSWPSGFPYTGVVLRPTALKVTQSSGLTMSIAGGAAIVNGSRANDQGAYFCYNNGAKSLALSAAPTAPNNRIDAVIARVFDTEKGESTDTWAIAKVDGTPSTTPVPPDLSSLDDFTVLAYITVTNAGAVTISDQRHIHCLDGSPIGSVVDHAGNVLPHGYLPCDGAGYSTTSYPDLFAMIGYTHGGSAGTFNVPDMRGRTATAPDNMNPAGSTQGDAGRMSYTDTLGASGGASTHTLITSEMPGHTHTIVGHNATGGATGGVSHSGTGATDTVTTASTGGDNPHNNVQPFLALNKIIRAY